MGLEETSYLLLIDESLHVFTKSIERGRRLRQPPGQEAAAAHVDTVRTQSSRQSSRGRQERARTYLHHRDHSP